MEGYLLQVLKKRDWAWTSHIYWSRFEAVRAGKRLFKRRPPGARRVRILRVAVDETPTTELSNEAHEAGGDPSGDKAGEASIAAVGEAL